MSMTETASIALLWGAASIALLHTLIGADHYLPFIVIGKARRWSAKKTLSITALCGLGHVTGSVMLGLIGVSLGVAVQRLEWIESVRGSFAAWGLITFGLIYAAYSVLRSARGYKHSHVHAHEDGRLHTHEHDHHQQHAHMHEVSDQHNLTKWTLFILFVFGPCEALIPMFMVPAFEHNWFLVVAVAVVFSTVTIVTMLAAVSAGLYGFSFISLQFLEKHANTLAGLAIASSGLAIQVLGI
jgi:ABC-type nickel/cobalt efflux system permease component RcnA